ncbi:MAG: TonB-dependent receptor [Vicingaceae bacterium]|nr:TonB-dependent receptor [Vicingaceae bacterium]
MRILLNIIYSWSCLILLITSSHYSYSQVTSSVNGYVKDEMGLPIFTATIYIDQLAKGAVTDDQGRFMINDVPPGSYSFTASFLGYKSITKYNVVIKSVGNQPLNFVLEENSDSLDEFTVVGEKNKLSRPKETPISSLKLTATEIETYPGGNNDVVRVAQSLPGVSPSIGGFRNDLIIRGGAPNETVYYLDGVEVPNINHFSTQGSSGGPVGMLNVSFIDNVELSSSAFNSKYDNVLSGVMQFEQKSGNKRDFSGNFRVGASETALTINTPLLKGKKEESKTGAIISVRRSYLQFLFQAIGLPIRPDYWDYQYKIDHKINDYNYLYLIGLGSIDDFYLDGSGELDDNARAALEQSPYIIQRTNTIGLTWKNIFKSGKGFFETTLSNNSLINNFSRYEDNVNQENLLFENDSEEMETHFRSSLNYYVGPWKLNGGVLIKNVNYKNTTTFVQLAENYGTDINFYRYGLFSNASRSFFNDKLDLSVGFRIDDDSYTTGTKEISNISPRIALGYKLTENWKLNATAGRYFKIPPYTILGFQQNNEFVNTNVKYIQSDHLGVGIERFLGPASSVSLEGFYKLYDNYPVSINDEVSLANKGADFEVLGNEEIASIGKGRAYGLEFFYQQKLTDRFYGVFSYTYFYSEFSGLNSNNYLPSLWDSRHLASFTGGYQFKRNWELSLRYRFAGQTPYVPVDINATTVTYPQVVLDYSSLGNVRLGSFNQLDIRVDKKWNLKKLSVNLYFEIQNALAQTSPSPSNYILERNEQGGIAQPRNLIEVASDNSTPIPSFGLVIDF